MVGSWKGNNLSSEVLVQILIEICTLDAATEPSCVTIACADVQTYEHKVIDYLVTI